MLPLEESDDEINQNEGSHDNERETDYRLIGGIGKCQFETDDQSDVATGQGDDVFHF